MQIGSIFQKIYHKIFKSSPKTSSHKKTTAKELKKLSAKNTLSKISSVNEFEEKILKSKKDSVVMFGGDWCRYCVEAKPAVLKKQTEYPKLDFFEVDAKNSDKLCEKEQVTEFPTVKFYKAEKLVNSFSKYTNNKDFEERLLKIISS